MGKLAETTAGGRNRKVGMHRIGYACINNTIGKSTNQTCRLQNATEAKIAELIGKNLDSLSAILDWNHARNIRMFRMGSGLVPFGSHPQNTLDWWNVFAERFQALGNQARAYNIRLSMHPGQYVNINAPTSKVVESSIQELQYHARILEALKLTGDSKLIIHVGGLYGDKDQALARFITAYQELPETIRKHLVLEHDDRLFTVWDVLRVYDACGIPIVFDNLHHELNNTGTPADRDVPAVMTRCFATWDVRKDGHPKIHFAQQAIGGLPGAHSEAIDPEHFMGFIRQTETLPHYDIMLECKDKEKSVLRLQSVLPEASFNLQSV